MCVVFGQLLCLSLFGYSRPTYSRNFLKKASKRQLVDDFKHTKRNKVIFYSIPE